MMKRTNKKVIALLLASSMLAMLLAGCKNTDTPTPPVDNGESPSGEETISSKDTMIIGCYGEPQSMFPANDGKVPGAHMAVNIYECLLSMDANGDIKPLLAESYTQVDERTYEFKLKQGVKFHNGEEFKASDVLFSMNFLCQNPVTASLTTGFDPTGFKVVDDYTIVLTTKEPFAPFLSILCNSSLSLFSEKFYNEAGDKLDVTACGTGPFQFIKWNSGDNIILERFEDYHGEKAKMKTLNMRYIPEANSRMLELETGGIDLMTEVPGISIDQLSSNPELKLWTGDSVGMTFLALNFDRELLSDTKVRRAIAHAIDNDALRKACLMDAADTANSFLPPTVPGAKMDLEGYKYDVELAKQLLTEAGFPNGIELPLAFFQSSDNRRMGEALQAMLKDANINLTLSEMESSIYTPFLNSRKQSAAITTLNNTLRDPYQTLNKIHSSACGLGSNRVNYSNPEMDAKLDAAASETDWDTRAKMYAEIQQAMFDEVIWIPLYSLKINTATTSKIRGFSLEYPASYQNYAACYFVE